MIRPIALASLLALASCGAINRFNDNMERALDRYDEVASTVKEVQKATKGGVSSEAVGGGLLGILALALEYLRRRNKNSDKRKTANEQETKELKGKVAVLEKLLPPGSGGNG